MILDLPQLLAPIPGDVPAGVDLRVDPAAGDVYYRMKDARSVARAAERAADTDAEAGRPDEWRILLDLSQDVLASRTKDLEIAAWLTEAALRLHGFAGLRDGFALMDGLVESFWDTLHSVDTETVADKVAPLLGLNGAEGDGTLIQPIRLTPITTPAGGAGLWLFMAARRGGPGAADAQRRVDEALRATDAATFVAVDRDVRGAQEAFAALTARLDALCGPDAPPSANIRNVLEEVADKIKEIAGPAIAAALAASTAVADAPAAASVPGGPAPAAAPAVPAAIQDRDDALQQLSRIALFFQRSEPNSPTGYVLETLARRARLPLADLLKELVPDETTRRGLMTAAGIGAPPDGTSS